MSHSTSESPRPALSQYWDTEVVPAGIAELCATFGRLNPDFDHRVYDKGQAERFIAGRFGARELAAFRACAVPAMQADYFRYCAGFALGGIYADADFECLRPLRPLLEGTADGALFFGRGERLLGERRVPRVWNGFFAFTEPGHPLLELTLEIATTNIESRLAERLWPSEASLAEHDPQAARWSVMMGILLTVGPGIFTLLWLVRSEGSFEAARRHVEGTPLARFLAPYLEAIGDYSRIDAAFDGVRIGSLEEMHRWVAHPAVVPAYKETDVHWHNWHNTRLSIFT